MESLCVFWSLLTYKLLFNLAYRHYNIFTKKNLSLIQLWSCLEAWYLIRAAGYSEKNACQWCGQSGEHLSRARNGAAAYSSAGQSRCVGEASNFLTDFADDLLWVIKPARLQIVSELDEFLAAIMFQNFPKQCIKNLESCKDIFTRKARDTMQNDRFQIPLVKCRAIKIESHVML